MDIVYMYPLIGGLCVAATSLIGVMFMGRWGYEVLRHYNHHLLAFSLGVLCVTLFGVGHEGLEHFAGTPELFALGALLGALLLFLSTRLHPHHHHASSTEYEHHHNHSRLDASHLVISDIFHTIADGIVLATAFLAGISTGFATTIALALHESIKETAKFFILVDSGHTHMSALRINIATACSVFIGIAAVLLTSTSSTLTPWLFALSFGAFSYLILVDIVPCVFFHQKSWRTRVKYFFIAALGSILMLGVQLLFPH
jgi:zinc and cadmium transporter